jgi:transposase
MKNKLLLPSDRLYVELSRAKTGDKMAYMKLSVLVFLDEGMTQEQTAFLLGISKGTVYNCKQKYEDDGIDKYLDRHYVPYLGRLDDAQLAALESEVDEGLYSSTAEVADWIARQFEVDYSQSGVRAILKKLDFVHKKALLVPGNLNVEEQEAFLKEFEPFLKEAEPDDEAIYFTDGMHPQHNTRADFVWTKRGKEKQLQSNTGRNRMNINGAINFCDPTDAAFLESDRINGESTRQLFELLLNKHPDKSVVYVIADNAKYYYNKELLAWLDENPKLQLLHLPTYSPNLNLIERLWKFLRKKVINLKFYPKFEGFRAAILDFFKNIGQYKEELTSLMTPNFQRFSVSPRT